MGRILFLGESYVHGPCHDCERDDKVFVDPVRTQSPLKWNAMAVHRFKCRRSARQQIKVVAQMPLDQRRSRASLPEMACRLDVTEIPVAPW